MCFWLALAAGFAVFSAYELRYALYSTTTEGRIETVKRDQVGFNHSKTRGTTPRTRFDVSYTFECEDKTIIGESSVFDESVREGDRILVQYINANPAVHRLLTPRLRYQWLGVVTTVGVVWLVFVTSSIIILLKAIELMVGLLKTKATSLKDRSD